MQHVAFVNDDELPEAYDWAFVRDGGNDWLLVKQSKVTAELLTDAWRTLMESLPSAVPAPTLVAA